MRIGLLLIGLLVCPTSPFSAARAEDAVACDNGKSGGQTNHCSQRDQETVSAIARTSRHRGHDDEDPDIADLSAAIYVNPIDVQALINRGRAYTGRGDFDEAIADFNLVISLDSSKVDAYVGRGNAYRGKGDLNRAIADYKLVMIF